MTRAARPATEVTARIAGILALLVLMTPAVDAHLGDSRPVLQLRQFDRLPDIQPEGEAVRVDLVLSAPEQDPLRHLVSHFIDPTRGTLYVEYVEDASVLRERFYAFWDFERLVEFRDANADGRFEAASDTVVRSWRFANYEWRRGSIDAAQLQDVKGFAVTWEGNLTGSPSIKVQAAFAGKDFVDEGALVRAQDVILYVDITNIPERGIGSLYAFEVDVKVPADAALSLHEVNKTATAILADSFLRRAFLVWGGEGFLDGREQLLDATIVDRASADGNDTARLLIHMPTVDESMRFVLVSGIEYGSEASRSPTPSLSFVPLAAMLVLAALARRSR